MMVSRLTFFLLLITTPVLADCGKEGINACSVEPLSLTSLLKQKDVSEKRTPKETQITQVSSHTSD